MLEEYPTLASHLNAMQQAYGVVVQRYKNLLYISLLFRIDLPPNHVDQRVVYIPGNLIDGLWVSNPEAGLEI